MESLAQDVRYAFRTLAKRPGFTAVVVLTLAFGLGANTAIFSLVDAVLLHPLPFAEADDLVQIWERKDASGRERNVVSPANFVDWRRETESFAEMAGFWRRSINLAGLEAPEEVQIAFASPGIFRLLRLPAAAGRVFAEDDVPLGEFSSDGVVLSHDFWQRRFGGDPDAVGRSVTVGSSSVTIIGVAAAEARLVEPATDLWMPTTFAWANRVDEGRFIQVVGRLAPGVELDRARAEMAEVSRRLEQAHPDFNTGWGVSLVPLAEQLVGDVRPALLLLLAAVALLLLVACANVANLLLARAAGREREIAIRTALGAGSGRIFRQLATESVILVVAAAVLGLWLGTVGTGTLLTLLPDDLAVPQMEGVHLNGSVLAFTTLLTLATGLVFGLVPALGTWSSRLTRGLGGGRGESGSRRHRWLRNGLVVAEIALALVLVLGAGLLFRSFVELRGVDPGLDLENVLTARVTLPRSTYDSPETRTAFFAEAGERLAALPGVESASAIQWLPLSGRRSATTFFVEDRPQPEPGAEPVTDVRVATPGYFETVAMPLLAGRTIDGRDHVDAPPVAVVNETLARRFWPGENAVGKRLSYSWGDWVSVEVVGVVGDVHFRGVDTPVDPALFRPHAQDPNGQMNLVIRSAMEPASLIPAVTLAIRGLDANLPVANFKTLADYHSGILATPRLNMLLTAAFSLLALALAAVGVYGLMSYAVTQRTREIGIRMALGAERGRILALVVRHGLALAAAGVALGLAGAFALTRLLESLLFGVSATDLLTFTAVPLVLVATALAACLLPARRASRVDPTVTLRYE